MSAHDQDVLPAALALHAGSAVPIGIARTGVRRQMGLTTVACVGGSVVRHGRCTMPSGWQTRNCIIDCLMHCGRPVLFSSSICMGYAEQDGLLGLSLLGHSGTKRLYE